MPGVAKQSRIDPERWDNAPGNACPRSQRPALLHTAALIAGLTLFSRILGLLRDMGMAWLLGSGFMADALVVAMRLPHTLRRLLGEGSLSMTMTASLVQQRTGLGQRQALVSLSAAMFWRLGLSLLALSLAGLCAAPWLAAVLAPGFSELELATTTDLLRICLPYVFTAGMAALAMAVLHSCQIFWLPALSPAVFNLSMLMSMAAAVFCSWEPAAALAWGMLLGGLVQWLVQWLGLSRALPDFRILGFVSGSRERRDAWRCLVRLPAGVLGAAAPQLSMLAAMALASGLGEGYISTLYYAERLLELPMGLLGACLGMASLPVLSRLVAQHDLAGFSQCLSQAIRWALLLSLPAAAGLWAVGPQLVECLFYYGAFEQEAVRGTALALWAYLPALPVFTCNRCLLAGCNALGLVRHTAWSTGAAVLVTLAAAVILRHSFVGAALESLSIMVPALAVGLGACCQAWLLTRGMKETLRCREQSICLVQLGILCRQAGAALAAGLAAGGALACLPSGLWFSLMLSIAAGVLAWFAALCVWGRGELAVLRMARQKGDYKI